MNITHKFQNRITYDLTITHVADRLGIKMQAQDLRFSKTFEKVVDRVDQLRKEFRTTGELFTFMGEEDNFTVDPMNVRIVLQAHRARKNKTPTNRVEIQLEEMEEKIVKRRQGEQKNETTPISDPDLPKPRETEEERFERRKKDFQKEMLSKKEEWKEKMEGMKKERIKWQWTDNWGTKLDGTYEGEVKNEKPHGQGKWKYDGLFSNKTVEGEWKDGLLHGKAVENNEDGNRDEYEAKEGKYDGKYITYMNGVVRE